MDHRSKELASRYAAPHALTCMKFQKPLYLFAVTLLFSLHGTVFGFVVNPGDMGGGGGGYFPGQPGMASGFGNTKGEAYMEAVRRLPRGAREGRPIYTQQGGGADGVICSVRFVERSSVRGGGASRPEARAAAMAKLPRGAEAQDVTFGKEGGRHICNVSYVKRGEVKGRGKTRQAAHREAMGRLPRNATPGKVTYGGGEGRQGWLCELPYSWY